MKTPIVSVIIPTYNRAHLLPRAIKSVLSQTFQGFELIVVDDGSTDNTKETVENFQRRDKRIKYIWQENSGGTSKPRNLGIDVSRKKYLAFLDDDDEWLPKKLEKQIKLFEKTNDPKLGFVGCDAFIVNEKNNKEYVYKTPKYKNVFQKLLESDFICSTSSIMVKKEIIKDVGMFDENLRTGVDYDMWIRIAQKYDFDFVPEPLFKYYIHKSNITNTIGFERQDENLVYIFEKYRKYYEADSKLYSIKLRHDGSRYILTGKLRKGRKAFIKSIKLNSLNIKSYLDLILSLFGSRFYYKLSLIKSKLKELKVF